MAVTKVTNKVQLATDGVEDTFEFDFKITADSELSVTFTDSEGTDTGYVLDTDYTVVDGLTEDSGSIICTTPPAASGTITILRVMAQNQPTDLSTAGPLPAETLEDAFDRVTMICQDLQEQIDRASLTPVTGDPGETAITETTGDLRYVRLAGGTMTGPINMATNEINELSPGLTGTDAINLDQLNAKFHTSTGHDHDGTDAKKVLYSNIDGTGPAVGTLLTVHTGNVIQAHAPMAAAQAAEVALTTDYQDTASVSLVVPRATTYVMMLYSMQVTATVAAGTPLGIYLKFLRDSTQITEIPSAFYYSIAAGGAQVILVMPVAIQHVHQPGAAATYTFKVQAKLNAGSSAASIVKSGIQVIMWG